MAATAPPSSVADSAGSAEHEWSRVRGGPSVIRGASPGHRTGGGGQMSDRAPVAGMQGALGENLPDRRIRTGVAAAPGAQKRRHDGGKTNVKRQKTTALV